MRYLLTILFALAISFQSYAQQLSGGDAAARVGELINSSDYITLCKELPALRAKVSKPLLALADALVAHHQGRFEDSNKAIDMVNEFAPELGSEVIVGMLNLSLVNYLATENYKAGIEMVQVLMSLLPEGESAEENRRQLESMSRWFTALSSKEAVVVERPKQDVAIPVEVRDLDGGEHLVVDVRVGEKTEAFIFDTGCGNSNIISVAVAERLGVEIVAEDIIISGVGEGSAKLGYLPKMQIGDVTIRNATFYVVDKLLPDDVEVEGLCEAALGTHIIRKMGEIRFEREQGRFVLPAQESIAPKERNIFFESQYYIWCNEGEERIVMQFDTGNSKTCLSSKYYERFKARVNQDGGEVTRSQSAGFGGVELRDVLTLPEVAFEVGGQALHLKNVKVALPIQYEDGTPYIEPYDGVAGTDFVKAHEIVTFDLNRMFFRIEK